MQRLKDRVAIITGSGQGLGLAVATAMAREGASVVIAELDPTVGEAAAAAIAAEGGRAAFRQIDVSSFEAVQAMVAAVIEEFETVDILVNNAGISRPAMLHKMEESQWDAVLGVHLKGTFNTIHAVSRHMIERKQGKIINVTSSAGLVGTFGQINYGAAKAGIVGVTKSAARELARYGVCVNAVAPTAETRMTEKVMSDPKLREITLSKIPMGRLGKPEEIAPTFVFLASDDANFITGQVVCVDGGLVI